MQSTQASAVREPDIVWVQLRGANVLVPNKDQEEWRVREAVIWHKLGELAASKPQRDIECCLRIYRTPEAEHSNDEIIVVPSVPSPSVLAVRPPPPPPPAPVRLQPSAEFLQRFASHHSLTIKLISDLGSTASVHGENQVMIDVGDILWLGRTQVEVSSTEGTYYLWAVDGSWRVFGRDAGICACD